MVFYEDFIKKLDKATFLIKEREVYHMEILKLLSIVVLFIVLGGLGIFQGYLGYTHKSIVRAIFGVVLIAFAINQFKIIFKYKMVIDKNKMILRSGKVDINLNDIETCTLKEMKLGKHLRVVLDMVNNKREQFIIPFYMSNKLKFAYEMKQLMGEKFNVIK